MGRGLLGGVSFKGFGGGDEFLPTTKCEGDVVRFLNIRYFCNFGFYCAIMMQVADSARFTVSSKVILIFGVCKWLPSEIDSNRGRT